MRRATALVIATALGASALVIPLTTANAKVQKPATTATSLNDFKHIVVIYEENHSFDNLYGGWGSVNGEPVNGLLSAPPAKSTQVSQAGVPFKCLLQNDVNLTSPPQPASCSDTTTAKSFTSAFPNSPFKINDYIPPTATTCPKPGAFAANGFLNGTALPGGCTEDVVHRYYQEQYQIDGGKMDRYTTGSDAVGLTQGYYDTAQLPIYQYLHSPSAPKYVIDDNFFQSAFGGSFLNHQWLISAATPTWEGAVVSDGSANDLHSAVGPDGSPKAYPLHTAPSYVRDNALTEWCTIPTSLTATIPAPPAGTTCGDYAINTIQPTYQPFAPGTADSRKLPPIHNNKTIGDELNAKGVDWAWYSGGWDNADGHTQGAGWTNGTTPGVCTDPNTAAGAVYPYCPNAVFQFHHQPFNYYANFAPGTANRSAHLQDEQNFVAAARAGTLKPVSFIKPIGLENEHPGYASESSGSSHLVALLQAIAASPNAKDTLVIVTYDEFGGQWDHVSPPTAAGVSDKWGPGTRIPALVISPMLPASGVDHTSYDTTSILATIEKRFGVAPLSTRDAAVKPLTGALMIKAGVPPKK